MFIIVLRTRVAGKGKRDEGLLAWTQGGALFFTHGSPPPFLLFLTSLSYWGR